MYLVKYFCYRKNKNHGVSQPPTESFDDSPYPYDSPKFDSFCENRRYMVIIDYM